MDTELFETETQQFADGSVGGVEHPPQFGLI